jgi:hypothetical protein
MKRNHAELWTLDCETDPFEYGKTDIEPFIWGAYDGYEYHQFDTPDQVADFFALRDAVVYAHNGGKFDYFFMFEQLEEFTEIMVINGRLSRFNIGEAEFRDSWNILPFPLGAYKKDDMDYSIMKKGERDKPKNREKIERYLRGDVTYLWELVNAFRGEYGHNLTLASSALAAWRRIAKQKNPKSTRGFYNEYAPYYYGGRVECFEGGIIEKQFKVIDINSAYPFAMTHDHPYGQSALAIKRIPAEGVERCFISLECDSDGALPYRDPTTNKLTFPHARNLYHITGWEYVAAKECGAIRNEKVKKVVMFNESINFRDYVDHFFALKDDAAQRLKMNPNNSEANRDYIFAKLFLNSLYGKMAANPEQYKEHFLYPPEFCEAMAVKGGWKTQCIVGPHAIGAKPLAEEKQNYFNVATAASITGFVRAMLFKAIAQSDTPLYCDTDSIACVGTGSLDLHPTRLGAWDVEAECKGGAIAGKKLYAFELVEPDKKGNTHKLASKGAKLTAEQIYTVASGHTVEYVPIAPTFSLSRGVNIITRDIKKTA